MTLLQFLRSDLQEMTFKPTTKTWHKNVSGTAIREGVKVSQEQLRVATHPIPPGEPIDDNNSETHIRVVKI